jgi:hypothetical protein
MARDSASPINWKRPLQSFEKQPDHSGLPVADAFSVVGGTPDTRPEIWGLVGYHFSLKLAYNRSLENPTIKLEACLIKKGLTDELMKAHSQLAELNDRDVQCILRGDQAGSAALTDQVEEARARRERALEAFDQHTVEHGCQNRVA